MTPLQARVDSDDRPLAILLMGPTASGKTDLALELATALPCDIVSVDSAQVFRGMDIGTAKPAAAVLAAAPHRLIDIRDPSEVYSAAGFRRDALREMEDIVAAGRVPLLVGGTMLYFRALQRGLSMLPEGDLAVRQRLDAEAREVGWEAMHRRLLTVDPLAAARIHPNDPHRIQRALEVYRITGRPMSLLQRQDMGAGALPYRLIKLVRAPRERSVLHQRVERRFGQMLALGLEQEVKGLRGRGDLSPDLPSMRCVGYRQMLKYLSGEYTYGEMEQRAIIATRQLAKRQLTWLRAESDCIWLFDDADPAGQARRILSQAGL